MPRQLNLDAPIVRPRADGNSDNYDKGRILTLHIRTVGKELSYTACIHDSVSGLDADSESVQKAYTVLPTAQQDQIDGLLDYLLGELVNDIGAPMSGAPEPMP